MFHLPTLLGFWLQCFWNLSVAFVVVLCPSRLNNLSLSKLHLFNRCFSDNVLHSSCLYAPKQLWNNIFLCQNRSKSVWLPRNQNYIFYRMSMLDGIPTTNVIDSDYQTAKWGQKYHKCFPYKLWATFRSRRCAE